MSLILYHIMRLLFTHYYLPLWKQKNSYCFLYLLLRRLQLFPAEVAQANEIIITGSSSTPNGPPRVPAAPTVEASQTGDIISVYFLADLGNVNITITSETGETMYQNTVTSGYGVSEMIDTLDFSEGSYTITFTNSGSLYLYGTFEI